ncbi:MAG: UpxY family transcription antiterminator [Bacteroidota bacterium]|nr:UpxY family transcription antiterminator [Bacteroidota bacterium]
MAELSWNETRGAEQKRWLVLYTRPRYEKKIHRRLQDLSVTSFLPLREELRQWSDRRKRVLVPLFSGYLFVFANERERIAALEVEGAMRYVSFGGKLAEVSEETIESLKIAATRPADIRVEETDLRLGQKVTVRHGPLAGMRGYLVEFRGSTRVAIRIEAIEKTVSVEVPLADLEHVKTAL